MKALFSWLKEFLEISLPPEALAERLTLSGAEVTALSRVDGDWLFELEITPNRPDLLSHLGLAREIAAILGRRFHLPLRLEREAAPARQIKGSFPIAIEDPQGCRRYVGIVIEGVEVKPSPPSVIDRLSRLGIRPVNNVVDATNLCLLELGQPLHAFDLGRLQGPSIRVRRALKEENLVTLDGTTLKLSPELLVIADDERPVALAGVMGGQDSQIQPTTQRVLLESAWFDPALIRRAVRITKLSSESSYRFERGVDLRMVEFAALRAAGLISRLASGTLAVGPVDVGEKEVIRRPITLNPRRAQTVLGMRIYPAQQRRLLERLGCKVSGNLKSWRVMPPTFRGDLNIPEDLYEELARLWGYERCLATLPPAPRLDATSWRMLEEPRIAHQAQIRQCLVAAGLQEILTYSLISPQDHDRLEHSMEGTLALKNPISSEYSLLRKTLLAGALQTTGRNLNRKGGEALQLFELGHVYVAHRKKGLMPEQLQKLALLVAGTPPSQWGIPSKPLGLFHLKGIVEFLCQRLGVHLLEAVEREHGYRALQGSAVVFRIGNEILGAAGWVDRGVLEAFDIPEATPVAYAELNAELLMQTPKKPLRVTPITKVAPVTRDLAILLAQEIPHEEVIRSIREAGRPLLSGACLFDLYRGPQVPSGKKSLAFRLSYSAGDRTLTDEEVWAAHQKIISALNSSFQATLR